MEDQASVKNGTEDLPYIHHITGPPCSVEYPHNMVDGSRESEYVDLILNRVEYHH